MVVATPRRLAPARWSRFASRHVHCPPTDAPDQFLDWLVSFGRREPGHVLYPTSDEAAWLFATNRAELARHFAMYQPSADVLVQLLDKRQLLGVCAQVGVATPQTFAPRDDTQRGVERELTVAVDDASFPMRFPLLVKPTTQVLLNVHLKGSVVPDRASLVARYRAFQGAARHHAMLLAQLPTAGNPILQAYYPEAAEGIYSIAGFVDGNGEITALAARKVLQLPRRLGTGLCFEAVPPSPALIEGLSALCRRVRYFGVFEAEFIEASGRSMMIDFNPRFYGQMAFEIDRGLPLPMIAYEAALGRFDELARARAALETMRSSPSAVSTDRGAAYTHRAMFELVIRGQRLFRRMTRSDAQRWIAWRRAHRSRLTDAVLDDSDWIPALVDFARTVGEYLRHPRAFVRSVLLDR